MSIEYEKYRKLIDEHILDFLPDIDSKSNTLYEAMKYSLLVGGKRLRPVLLLGACEFCGGDVMKALPYACAMEYIHTYSLIHDDLPDMDDDDLRRGKPSNHKVFGNAMAILAGDGLLSSAFEAMNKDMLLYFDDPEMVKSRVRASYEISKGAGCKGMVAGQVADIEAEQKQCSGELLEYIHVNKTGAMIVAAIRAGAFLGKPKDTMLEDLTSFGENIGLAFQITDDILDVVGNVEELGKMTGADDAKGKATFVSCYGLQQARDKVDELTANALAVMEKYYDNAELFNYLAENLAGRTK